MSGAQRDACSASPHHRSMENGASLRQARFFEVEGNGEDMDFDGDKLGISTATSASASAKRVNASNLHSMVPDDDTLSESSSHSSGDDGSGGLPQDSEKGGGGLVAPISLRDYTLCGQHVEGATSEKIEVNSNGRAAGGGMGVVEECDPSLGAFDAFLSQNGRMRLWDSSRLFFRLLSFFDCRNLCNVMLVCKRFYRLATHDKVWFNILIGANLRPLLLLPNAPMQKHYRYFIEQIITTKAIHGHYSFEAEASDDVRCTSVVKGGSERDVAPSHSSPTAGNSIFTIGSVTLFLSSASLGQMNHTIGRVNMVIEYKDNTTEAIQGAARFSWRRGCFMFCCSSFVSNLRGPVFTVAISTTHKPWPNQSPAQFQAHKGGLRFIMTPVLLEGQIPGLRITENDVISVSRPPVVAQQANASLSMCMNGEEGGEEGTRKK